MLQIETVYDVLGGREQSYEGAMKQITTSFSLKELAFVNSLTSIEAIRKTFFN